MTERAPTPRDFPVLFTMREARKLQRLAARTGRPRTYAPCPCCGLAIDPRNRRRHAAACRRRKRLAPELWAEWRKDMHPS